MKHTVLIVEDNSDMRANLSTFLTREDFSVFSVSSTEEGIDIVDEETLDVALVDINLPGKSGFEMIEYIRDQHHEFPVLALTARDALQDKLRGFEVGVNDYIIKPFDLSELRARIRAHLRTTGSGNNSAQIKTRSFKLDPKSLRFELNGTEIELTQLEFRMMQILMQNKDTLVEIEELIDYAWGESSALVNPPVRIHIANLRKKINDSDFQIIKTVPGRGYIFRDEL